VKKFLTLFLILFLAAVLCAPADAKLPRRGDGYVGTLPDISRFFQYKKTDTTHPEGEIVIGPVLKDFLLDAPLFDDVFLDVIIKKDPNSRYVNDLQPIIRALQKVKRSVERNEDIQRFNATVNVLDLHVSKLQRDYGNKDEGQSESFIELMDVNYRAKLVGNLRFDANYYSRYMAVLEFDYTKEGLEYHGQLLAEEIDRVIDILRQAR
jgi:hypothetical protein